MSFPSSVGTKQDDLIRAWDWIRSSAGTVKQEATQLRAASASGPIGANLIVQFAQSMADAKDLLARATAVPGIAAYVQSQINSPALDIVAEYTAMVVQIDAVRAWIVANFPKDGGGFLLYHSFDAQGRLVLRTLTTVQTAGLRTQLDALIATID